MEQKIMRLILMRGVSGSGKSTLAREIASQYRDSAVYSTDDFFMVEGKYKFDPRMLSRNHFKNFKRVQKAMEDFVHCIIVDNTNLQKWEMLAYVEEAITRGYQIEIKEPEPVSIEELVKRQELRKDENKNLSREVIERQLERYQPTTIEELISACDLAIAQQCGGPYDTQTTDPERNT